MDNVKRFSSRRPVIATVGVLLLFGIAFAWLQTIEAEARFAAAPAPLEAPPEGQTYLGDKECSACHFDQYLTWRKTKHAKTFELLPPKYQTVAACLECHSTGYGTPTGFKDIKSTPALAGTTCEACHGPGSKHAEIAKMYGKKKLTDDEDAYVRSTIWGIDPTNACVKCHQGKAHKEHPKYDK